MTLNYSGLIASLGGTSLNYLGLYYGSIDYYNDLIFYDKDGNVILTITGQSLIDFFNGTSGDKVSNATNVYVNLFFTPVESFTSFSFTTSGVAFEMDNVAVGHVPEPATLALLGLGLTALGVSRRRTPKA